MESDFSRHWFVSFAGDGGFLGVLHARFDELVDVTVLLGAAAGIGLNPGGEALAIPLSEEKAASLPESLWWTLMDREALERQFLPRGGVVRGTSEGLSRPGTIVVCEDCNEQHFAKPLQGESIADRRP